MATKEIDQIIDLKSMYDYDLDETKELEIVKKDIKNILDLLGGGYGIATFLSKKEREIIKIKESSSGFNLQEDIMVEDTIFKQSLFNKDIPQIIDFFDFKQKYGTIIETPDNIDRILYLPIILKHATTEHNIGEIMFLYNQELFEEEKGELLGVLIDRLILRIRQSFTQDRMNRKVKQLETIIDISKEIETVKDKEGLLSIVIKHGLSECKAIFKHEVHAILRIREGDDLKVIYFPESFGFVPEIFKTIPPEFQYVIDSKKSNIIEGFQNSYCIKELLKENKENREYCSFLKKIKSVILIPIVTDNTVRGIFTFCSEDRDFGIAEKRFFKDMAVITAIAFDKLEAYQNVASELASKVKRLELLKTLMKNIISEKNDKRLLKMILESGLKLVDSESGNIRILDKETGLLKHVCYKVPLIEDRNMELGTGICGYVAKTGEPCKVDNVLKDPRWKENIINQLGKRKYDEFVKKGPISEISVPLKDGETTIGTIDALKFKSNGFSKEDFEIYKDLGVLSGIVLKRSILQNKLDTIKNIAAYYPEIKEYDLDKIFDEILGKSFETISCSKGSIAIINTIDGKNNLEYLSVENVYGLYKGKQGNITEDIINDIIKCSKEEKLDDVSGYINHKAIDNSIKSEIVVPIIFQTKLKGILMVASLIEKRFDDSDVILLKAIANQAGIMIQTQELIKERDDVYKEMENELIQNLMHMSGMIAHQINTHLMGIHITFSNIRDELRMGGQDIFEDIDCINNSIDKISIIIGRIKDFTKKAGLELKYLNLHEVLDEALNFTQGINIRKNITITKDYDKNRIKKFGFDRFKMFQVFINIIDNAFNAMNEMGGHLTIGTVKNNGNINIIIKDDGKGIPDENKQKIFQSFFTTDEVHGTGLGLSISKRFVELHGGEIKMESTEGKGAKFIITLPCRREEMRNEPI